MGGHRQILRHLRNRIIVQAQIQLLQLLDIITLPRHGGPKSLVAQHPPRAVIQLDVPAAQIIKGQDHLAVGVGNIPVQLLPIGVDGLDAVFIHPAHQLGEKLGGCGNGLPCGCFLPRLLLQEAVMFQERMPGKADFAGQSGRIRSGFHAVEHVTLVHHHMLHTIEAPEEIQMPVAAAEFPVRHGLQAQLLLLVHQVADYIVLRLCQCIPGIGSGGELLPCFLQRCRTQEAADYIIAVRGGSP
ncbi:hypothetical protein D3C81_1246260 [compost metagenome]